MLALLEHALAVSSKCPFFAPGGLVRCMWCGRVELVDAEERREGGVERGEDDGGSDDSKVEGRER